MKIFLTILMLGNLAPGSTLWVRSPNVIPDRRDLGADVFALRPTVTRSQYEGLLVWLTAEMPVQDAGTTNAVWPAAGSALANFTQTTLNSQPETAVINGVKVLRFDGDDFISAANHASLNPATGLTIGGWFCSQSTVTTRFPFYKLNSYEISYRDSASGSANGFGGSVWDSDGTRVRIGAGATHATNIWWHVMITATPGDVLKLFINGVEATEVPFTEGLPTASTPLNIGRAASGFEFTGGIEPYVYSRTFTPAEVLDLYNTQKARFGHD